MTRRVEPDDHFQGWGDRDTPVTALREAAQRAIDEYDRRSLWHDVDLEHLTDAMYAIQAALSEAKEPRASELDMARAIHETFHYGPATLTCMTKHRQKAKHLLARLATPEAPEG